jgi:hypothetical protein
MILNNKRIIPLKSELSLHNICMNSVCTSQETYHASAIQTNQLILTGETVAVYCKNRTEHTNTLCGQNAE